MATAQFAHRGATPNVIKSDLDMESFFNFGESTISSRQQERPSIQAGPSLVMPQAYIEEEAQFAGPSHEYDRFPQQTGVVSGSVADLSNLNQPVSFGFNDTYGGFNSGFDESSFDMSWDMDGNNMGTGMNGQIPFVDPTYIDTPDEPQSHVGRLWPGMHQEAAMQKAQQQAPAPTNKGKGRATQNDPETEQSISRLLNQMRQSSVMSTISEDPASPQDAFNLSKMKKDEDDMDDDERLLASEEGRKLTSKERRQLRNKVSARAFRSRRKEYIGQLEGEVAVKAQEVSTLKTNNQALTEENERYRALIQTLLRHPSFTPFIEDFSKDPAFIASQAQLRQTQSRSSTTPKPQQQQQQRSSMQMGDANIDMSLLNINGNGLAVQQNMNFDFSAPQNFQQQQQFSQVPLGSQSRQNSFY